jgi:membrane protease YdiL (CAAX protease family)
MVLLLRALSGTLPYQLGISSSRWPANVLYGFLVWLLLTPIVYLIDYGTDYAYRQTMQEIAPEHPLTKILRELPSAGRWLQVVFEAVLLAPLFEELLFRGIIQRWSIKRPQSGQLLLAAAFLLACVSPEDQVKPTWAPAAFVIVMAPGYYLIAYCFKRSLATAAAVQGIYGTALVFAASHNVWPSPIPLFFLGAALGWLAYRTQSLIGPVLVHGLFNGVTCLAIALTL